MPNALRLTLVGIVGVLAVCHITALAQTPVPTPKPGSKPASGAPKDKATLPPLPPLKREGPLPWLTSLADGKTQAQRLQRPVLVRVVSPTCPWCEKLDEALSQKELQAELERWVLVSIAAGNADEPVKEMRLLAVTALPALRVLTPAGRGLAAHDGFLPADKLLAWLRERHDKALTEPGAELTGEDRPELLGVVRLLAEFQARDPVVREAALRRLLPYPDVAAEPVVEALGRGPLQTRLIALELLHAWQAPVDDFDPWQPQTLAADKLAALAAWARQPGLKTPPTTQAQWDEIKKDITRLAEADELDAIPLRERLARHGRALLPEVVARLKDAPSDQARERLTALRYRLAASGALALNWPGGLERLAATAAAPRHQALRELETRVTARDEALLLELFSSPDPLVREISLRALKATSGAKATGALAQLLDDPEPNVRAAVLKQLIETPAPQLVPRLVEYIKTEQDPDLLVHAIRALRESSGPQAAAGIEHLLGHERWQVRAEAAEAIGKYIGSYGQPEEWRADLVVAMVKLLDDPDAFVVSRAIPVVGRFDVEQTVEPLVRVVDKHPDLAEGAVQALGSRGKTGRLAVPHLRRFCTHAHPAVRAAAIAGLYQQATGAVYYDGRKQAPPDPVAFEKELHAALQDAAPSVRTTAAKLVLQYSESQRHQSIIAGAAEANARAQVAAAAPWIDRMRDVSKQPDWVAASAKLLLPRLESSDAEERLAAAVTLTTLGHDDRALPVLRAEMKKRPDSQGEAAISLAWLTWDKRLAVFEEVLSWPPDPDHFPTLVRHFVTVPDERAAPVLWSILEKKETTDKTATAIAAGLQTLYYAGQLGNRVNGQLQIPAAAREAALKAVLPKIEPGPELRRIIALSLLLPADVDKAAEQARRLLAEESASAALRRDALHVLYHSQPAAKRSAVAVEGLKHPASEVRDFALFALAQVGESTGYLRDGLVYLYADDGDYNSSGVQSAPTLPKDFDRALLTPYLTGADPKNAAYAGYLLALSGDAEGLAPLERHWRGQALDDYYWQRRVYGAVAALGDDARTPLLEEIYQQMRASGSYYMRDFYWTIRVMDGPNVLKLRKRIRQEVGMANLQ